MGRHKTISDKEVLDFARGAFRSRGFAVTGREIAKLAGVSEAVLYQRFESKEALFFAAMAPTAPDILQILGPRNPAGDARTWILGAVNRISAYFEELLPLAIQVMLHPSSNVESTDESGPAFCAERIEKGLVLRLRSLQKRDAITSASCQAVARLLIGMAHDWALHRVVLASRSRGNRLPLATYVDLAWSGIAPYRGLPPKRRARARARA